MIRGLTIFEFDTVIGATDGADDANDLAVPNQVFNWLESLCRRTSSDGDTAWLRLTQRGGRRAMQVTSYVGVLRAPCGFQIEVLPKVGKVMKVEQARELLIEMLRCLNGFRHIQTNSALLAATHMPLFEVFIHEFLIAVEGVVKRGLRSNYVEKQDNVFALRGKLLISQHLQKNLVRSDRFYTEHDEFSTNRPENRLIHTALRQVIKTSQAMENQRLARELCFVFSEIPESTQVRQDFQRVRLDRGMEQYESALAWARLILEGQSPLTGTGHVDAPSLLFPMAAVFEAYVEKHLARQLADGLQLKSQACSHHLVRHIGQAWFRLEPDLLIHDGKQVLQVLDTKWKLLSGEKTSGSDKYQLSQADFYQLYAYGQHYLNGRGDVVLIYPKTDAFYQPLPVFSFPQSDELRLWVLPFCLSTRRLLLPDADQIKMSFTSADC